MGYHFSRYLAKAARGTNPLVWYRIWNESAGKQLGDVYAQTAANLNAQLAQISRTSQYRHWWWANPFGAGLLVYGVYKVWYMSYVAHKQRIVAQVIAAAYGQGGQWLNPVPR
ncbi:hypothetical protein BdWA1_001735 [Babesia duncani]|uniref:Uncharacterized protein n=1 Tax=Babesia duncani TaxID=323732 RepID=A0AAD9PKH5_9APIC|nr:hypothetical protein BdWA1_001735 [Babesia duncani]